MNKIYFLLFFGLFGAFSIQAQTELSLEEIIQKAKNLSTFSKAAETRKQNFYWQYRSYKANYNPSLNLRGDIPNYYRGFFSNRQDNGEIVYQSAQQINSNLNLGLLQPIALTGGQISINSNLNQFSDLDNDNLRQYNTTPFNIQLTQPIFGFNQLKWDKRTEPLRYEESKRSYVEEMEFISQRAVNLYFNYLDAQINLQIATFNLANNDTIYHIEEGRYNIGTTSKDKLLQVELQLLRSQQDVAQAKLDLQTARLALRSFVGQQNIAEGFDLIVPGELPIIEIPLDKALEYSKMNRADYIAFERRRQEADRDVARAKSSRFQANLTASYGLNNAASSLDQAYIDPVNQQRFNISLSVPILDWGRTKSRVQTALANQQLTNFTLAQDIQNFEQEIITLVSRFEVLNAQVEITKKSDEVAQERYEVAQNRYLIGKIDITNLNIALTEKDNARRSYVNVLRSYWTAYFDLRRLTLYDFIGGELLYVVND